MLSIPTSIQRFERTSTLIRSGAAHPEPPAKERHQSRTSILKRSLSATAAVTIFAVLLSLANATYRQDTAAAFPDVTLSAATDRAPIVLTSHLPCLAPVGHRQPHQADVPQHDAVSAWEHQQQQVDQELDRKLIICRGC